MIGMDTVTSWINLQDTAPARLLETDECQRTSAKERVPADECPFFETQPFQDTTRMAYL
ncbi:MAG: hypothetical protein AAF581_23660 [Planctomycetota bacterium]